MTTWKPAIIVCIAALALAMFMALGRSHEAPSGMRYDTYCCNGNAYTGDCEPIPAKSVKVVKGGFLVVLGPGDHRLVTVPHSYTKAQSETRPSTDGQYHACLWPSEKTLRCLYVPPFGY